MYILEMAFRKERRVFKIFKPNSLAFSSSGVPHAVFVVCRLLAPESSLRAGILNPERHEVGPSLKWDTGGRQVGGGGWVASLPRTC